MQYLTSMQALPTSDNLSQEGCDYSQVYKDCLDEITCELTDQQISTQSTIAVELQLCADAVDLPNLLTTSTTTTEDAESNQTSASSMLSVAWICLLYFLIW